MSTRLEKLHARRRVLLLVTIMVVVAGIIGVSAIYIIYRGSIEREHGRLQGIVQSQARMLDSLARFDRAYSDDSDGAAVGTIKQFIDLYGNFTPNGMGRTGEVVLARRVDDKIVYLLRHRSEHADVPMTIPIDSGLAAPMRAALDGQSGIMQARDYAGDLVLAAYYPVPSLGLGLVAKIDIAEIRQRFTRAALPLMAIATITVLAGVTCFIRVTEPVMRRLGDSEARFRGTFDNAAVGIAHVAFDGCWLRVNDRLCEIVGYTRDELLSTTFQNITHPDDLQADLDVFGLLMRGEIRAYSNEKRYLHKDGHLVWVNLTVALQRNDVGRPLYCISIVEDISRRKKAEQTLQESENRMRAVLDASEDEVLLVSTEGRVLAINKAAERRLAGRLAALAPVGADLDRLLPADLAAMRLARVREVAASGNPVHMDLEIRDRWFEFWFYPVRHAGQPISEVAVFARDISERKRAEGELRRLYEAIQQSPSSIVITDPDGRIVYVNPKFSELTGYSYEEVIGKNPRVLKSGYTSDEEYKNLWRTITSGRRWQGEFNNRKKDGTLYWEIASIAPVKDEAGRITNFVAVKEDVTERRAVEEQLRQSQKMQAIGQLTGGIAHDFNNLLTIILGNLQLLERATERQHRSWRLITDALWAAKRGGELTHRLLAFARLQPLNPAQLNLNHIVRGLIQLLRRTLGTRIDVVEVLDAEIPNVFADAGELERALVNLAINARDAMPDGGRLTLQTGRVTLGADDVAQNPEVAPGRYVMLAVGDTGSGIPADLLGRIFEPFFTTKRVGEGSGLGLSMVWGFVRQSGGHISVASESGIGTTFKLFFPELAADTAARDEAGGDDVPDFVLSGGIALVVEDEERLRGIAARLLGEAAFTVLVASDGGEALRHAEAEGRIDLLFTDVELPGALNGIAIAERVRARHPAVRVLYTTGYSTALAAGNGRAPAGAPVLAKPYARQQLMRHLHTLFPDTTASGDTPAMPAEESRPPSGREPA